MVKPLLKGGDKIAHKDDGVADKCELAEESVGNVGDKGYFKIH